MPQALLNDCADLHYLLDSGANFSVMPRSILGRIKEIIPVKEFPIDDIEFSLARRDLTLVSRAKAELDVALETGAGRVRLMMRFRDKLRLDGMLLTQCA